MINECLIYSFLACINALDLVIIVDASGSITEEWMQVIRFIHELVIHLDIGPDDIQVGFMGFSTFPHAYFHLGSADKDGILEFLSHGLYPLDGHTDIFSGLRYLRKEMFSAENGDREGESNAS